jgi:uncharacterized protein
MRIIGEKQKSSLASRVMMMQKKIPRKNSDSIKNIKNDLRDAIPISTESSGDWEISLYKNIKMDNPILIEGMPGIGNVGKIVMDMLIEETGASLFMTFFSRSLPNSVFVNENNLVDLPKISMYHKRVDGRDIILLTGDVQPMTPESCFDFAQLIADRFKKFKGDHIVTLGGIGLGELPDTPKVYVTGNNKDFVNSIISGFDKMHLKHEKKIYGHVGPILGVSGVLLGISRKSGINAYCLLAETYGHPMYIGLKGAKKILEILNKQYGVAIKLEKLNKEIVKIDKQIQGIDIDEQDGSLSKYRKHADVNYIG